jgi:hypothetical protein
VTVDVTYKCWIEHVPDGLRDFSFCQWLHCKTFDAPGFGGVGGGKIAKTVAKDNRDYRRVLNAR